MTISSPFPHHRPRRLRKDDFSRRLVREHHLHADDLIYPVFVLDQDEGTEAVSSMPGVERLGRSALYAAAERCLTLGVPVLALFPVIDAAFKTPDGREAGNPEGLVPRTVRELKRRFPELGIMTDVALDPYTSHGQDGLLDETGYILNDETVEVLTRQALTQAEAGVDIVAPSDMMDGRIGAIRQALESQNLIHTRIMAYSAKYASAFYGPFRDAVGLGRPTWARATRRSTRWTRPTATRPCARSPSTSRKAPTWSWSSPGLPYLDIVRRVKDTFKVPTLPTRSAASTRCSRPPPRTAGWTMTPR